MTWPTIQCQPGPTDAELAAARDADHARDVAAWDLLWSDRINLRARYRARTEKAEC